MAEQNYPRPEPIITKNVKGSIYLIKGGLGANSGFFIGKNSVVVIDAKMTPEFGTKAVEEIRKVTSLPISHMIITHSDLDHVNGLTGFPKGMEIISHVNAKDDMEKAFADPSMKGYGDYLSTKAYDKKLSLDIDGTKIKLIHFGPAHTSGDTVVFFPAEKVVFGGDIVFIGRDPLVHIQKKGSSVGLINNIGNVLKLDADTYIFGHCEFVSKEDILKLKSSIEDKRKKIWEMIKSGKELDEVKAELGVKEMPMPPGRPRFPSLVEVMYNELKTL